MARPRRTYADDKTYARELVLDYLRDAHNVEIRDLRRYLHRRALDALLPVVLRDLQAEGIVEYDQTTQCVYTISLDKPAEPVV